MLARAARQGRVDRLGVDFRSEPAAAPAAVESAAVGSESAPAAVAQPSSRHPSPHVLQPPPQRLRNRAHDEPPEERRHPLRFVWQMDADGRFVVGSDEFVELVGPRTTAAFGRLWSEIAAELQLDPENQIARAVATHETWSGIIISWPVDDGSERLPVELSGLPVFDRDRNFRGYRGFGVCRDIDAHQSIGACAPRAADRIHATPRRTSPRRCRNCGDRRLAAARSSVRSGRKRPAADRARRGGGARACARRRERGAVSSGTPPDAKAPSLSPVERKRSASWRRS